MRYVLEDVTSTGTIIVGNDAPTTRELVREQVNEVEPLLPVHDHHAPVGVEVNVTPAGNGSVTVVVELVRFPEPTFSMLIVYV